MVKFNRGKNFIRATEMHTLSMEQKVNIVKCVKAMLEQIDISCKAIPRDYENRLKISEKIFSLFMEYPEILCTNPKLRNVAHNKLIEIINDLPRLNLNYSKILDDARYFFYMIQARPDYINFIVSTQALNKKDQQKKIIHTYNLRPRKNKIESNSPYKYV
jgi:hypothetical protein